MSRFSGKCDLADYIFGLGGYYDKYGNSVKFGQEGVGCYYSDVYQDFLAFKKRTNGVLHQNKKIKQVTEWNHDFIKEHCANFEIIPHVNKVADKRKKEGYRTETTYTYKYWDKEYTAKELSKKGVYIVVDIHFETLLDLIPYFPYIVSMACGDTVFISNKSYVEEQADESLQYGHERNTYHYRHALAEFYQECVLRYFNYKDKVCIDEVEFDEYGIGKVLNPIDTNFDLSFAFTDNKSYYESPKVIDAEKGIIKINKYDLKNFGNKINIRYIEEKERELWIV